MAELKEYVVELVVTQIHTYTVPARTPEEAASIAEDLLDDGNEGEVTGITIESADAYSSEEYDEEIFDEDNPQEIEFVSLAEED